MSAISVHHRRTMRMVGSSLLHVIGIFAIIDASYGPHASIVVTKATINSIISAAVEMMLVLTVVVYLLAWQLRGQRLSLLSAAAIATAAPLILCAQFCWPGRIALAGSIVLEVSAFVVKPRRHAVPVGVAVKFEQVDEPVR